MKRSHQRLKRFFDVIFSLMALGVFLPFWGIIAVLIKLDSKGPVLFRQWRLGKDGEPFKIYKFRTMYEKVPFITNNDGSAFIAEDDPRLTRVGKILRKHSIDEVPQFINVLKGEMSIIGPRPDLLCQIEFYSPDEFRKLKVKPGITGLSQVMGRNRISWRLRKKLDSWYAEHMNLKLDFKIFVKTLKVIFETKGVFHERRY